MKAVVNRSHLLALAALTLLAAATDPARASDAAAPERSEPVAAEEPSREPAAPATPARRWTSSAEIAGGSYRLSLSRGALDMGLGFDAPVRLGPPPAAAPMRRFPSSRWCPR